MLIGRIRPVEIHALTLEGVDAADIRAQAEAATPAGWELVAMPVVPVKGSPRMSAAVVFARRDGVKDIEADTMPALEARVPEGWELLSVQRL
ncbi:hypothetical protein [Microbacterium sp. No. 7]|uniref:hypothetical protein n=1 Tax=Microbacterium sp. No. 7 TaxID=1714373 RepID=UPI0006D2646C|nr:hypothetical protein [Microbacterium sp. No. 7]ALJ22031.1 hypothetical protein AOA12_19905 [Microbacterium sp. No. 7]